MKVKRRVFARVERTRYGAYEVKRSDGIFTYPYGTYEEAQKAADRINNDDQDNPPYYEVEIPDPDGMQQPQSRVDYWKQRAEQEKKRKEEREAKKEANRKSKKCDEKYVFVVSSHFRGDSSVIYLTGETNLTKIGEWGDGFFTYNEKKAKVFDTKAKAQKFIDSIAECWMIKKLFRDMNVVRKDKNKLLS